jgi:DegV family protein with EDD domain
MAESVRKEYEKVIPIIDIDTKQVTSGVGSILLRLIDLLQTSDNMEKIGKKMDKVIKNTFTYLCLPDLSYLYRGGRIGRAKLLLGSVLKIIPVVGLFGDEAELGILPVGKGRTFTAANRVTIDSIRQKMLKNKVETIKLITILHFEDNNSPALKDLEGQIKNELKYEKLIVGHPRLVEAIYTGHGAWVASFVLK